MTKAALLGSLALLALGAPPLPAAPSAPDRVAAATSGQAPEAGDLVFFPLDDVSIPWRQNLKVTLERPEKYAGNPVLKAGPVEGPDGYGALLYGTVIKEGAKYRMWYLASPRGDPKFARDFAAVQRGSYRPIAYAESADGIHWDRPDLGLVEFRGNKHNNLVAIEPASAGYATAYDFVAVLRDPADPDPGRRYKMAYITRDKPLDRPHDAASTATAVSPDGLRWTLANTAMFTQGNFENTSLTKFDGLYYLAGQAFALYDGSLADGSSAGRVMKVFFSPDFDHWSSGRALAFARADYRTARTSFGQENHMGAGLWNRGNVILGLYGRWHGDTILTEPVTPSSPLKGLKIDLGLVVSNDAIHYREPVRNFVMIPRGAPAAWDSEGILQANAFANTATETYIWYSHWYTSRPNVIPPLPAALSPVMALKADAIGLARLPRDRFGAFSKLLQVSQERRPEYNGPLESSCLTRSIRLTVPSRLYVNVDGLKAEDVRIENIQIDTALKIDLVDDNEKPLDGYSSTLTENSLKVLVKWPGDKTDLPVQTPFRIKITWPAEVSGGKVYAIYVEHD